MSTSVPVAVAAVEVDEAASAPQPAVTSSSTATRAITRRLFRRDMAGSAFRGVGGGGTWARPTPGRLREPVEPRACRSGAQVRARGLRGGTAGTGAGAGAATHVRAVALVRPGGGGRGCRRGGGRWRGRGRA